MLDAEGQPESDQSRGPPHPRLSSPGKCHDCRTTSRSHSRCTTSMARPVDWHTLFVRALTSGLSHSKRDHGLRPARRRATLALGQLPRCSTQPKPGSRRCSASFTDVTDERDAQLQLSHQAHHDSLTGLPNRAYAEAQATQALQADPPTLAAVMFIDLDNIKTVNDAFGHHAGDAVIKTAAERLRAALRSEDLIARHGGDEFVALRFRQRRPRRTGAPHRTTACSLGRAARCSRYLVQPHRQYRRDRGNAW